MRSAMLGFALPALILPAGPVAAQPNLQQTLAMHDEEIFLATLCWLVFINAWTALRFWQDKRRAIAGARRIPEADLLTLAFIGGSPGAFAARHVFRHKTRKQPFSAYLMLIAAMQAVGLAALLAFSTLQPIS